MKYFKNVILFKHHLGQKRKGVSKSPDILKQFLNLGQVNCEEVNCTDNIFDNLRNLYHDNNRVSGNRLNIGGDHSMAIASIAHSVNKFKNTKVIWFDAHADINTYEASESKNFHGMPLAYLTGLDDHPKIDFINNLLPFKNILYIGVRDIDTYERQVIEDKNMQCISTKNFNRHRHNTMKKIVDFIDNDPFHISFDVDCIDPLYVPCTGTPVDNGLNPVELRHNMHMLLNMKNCYSADLTELNIDGEGYSILDKEISVSTVKYVFGMNNINGIIK